MEPKYSSTSGRKCCTGRNFNVLLNTSAVNIYELLFQTYTVYDWLSLKYWSNIIDVSICTFPNKPTVCRGKEPYSC